MVYNKSYVAMKLASYNVNIISHQRMTQLHCELQHIKQTTTFQFYVTIQYSFLLCTLYVVLKIKLAIIITYSHIIIIFIQLYSTLLIVYPLKYIASYIATYIIVLMVYSYNSVQLIKFSENDFIQVTTTMRESVQYLAITIECQERLQLTLSFACTLTYHK